MLSKRKIGAAFFSSLIGALAMTTIAGVALTSCCTYQESKTTRETKIEILEDRDEKLYTTSINWDNKNALAKMTIDDQGLIYASRSRTEVIGVAPGFTTVDITIPTSVKVISGYTNTTPNKPGITGDAYVGAFENCTNIRTITFPEGSELSRIGTNTFRGCSSITSINLQATKLVSVGNGAFAGTPRLTNLSFPSTLEHLGKSVFGGALPAVEMEDPMDIPTQQMSTQQVVAPATEATPADGKKVEQPKKIPTGLLSVDLSKTHLTEIAPNAFSGSKNLDTIKLPTTITKIGKNAFRNCHSLTTLSFGEDDVSTYIGNFNGATSLVEIGESAFRNTGFIYVDLSKTQLTVVPPGLFHGCKSLNTIQLPATARDWRITDPNDYSSAPFGNPETVQHFKERQFSTERSLSVDWYVLGWYFPNAEQATGRNRGPKTLTITYGAQLQNQQVVAQQQQAAAAAKAAKAAPKNETKWTYSAPLEAISFAGFNLNKSDPSSYQPIIDIMNMFSNSARKLPSNMTKWEADLANTDRDLPFDVDGIQNFIELGTAGGVPGSPMVHNGVAWFSITSGGRRAIVGLGVNNYRARNASGDSFHVNFNSTPKDDSKPKTTAGPVIFLDLSN